MKIPFSVGDRVQQAKHSWSPKATVTAITANSFHYEYDEPFVSHPRLGLVFSGGECYVTGFHLWGLATTEDILKPTNSTLF